jgi:hypothetical protein
MCRSRRVDAAWLEERFVMARRYPPMLALLCTATSFASGPPTSPLPVGSLVARSALPTLGVTLGAVRVAPGTTTLAQLRRALGAGDGAREVTERLLCYTRIVDQRHERLWFVSDSEFGGADEVITRIVATFGDGDGDGRAQACPVLPAEAASLAFDAGPWLGATTGALPKALGRASLSEGAYRYYAWALALPADHGCADGSGGWVRGLLVARIVSQTIVELSISQATTC